MNFNREKFYDYLQDIAATYKDGDNFVEDIRHLIYLLDKTDENDFFGKEGWEHYVGWGD